MQKTYEELGELVDRIMLDYGFTDKEAFDIALKIQANHTSEANSIALVNAIVDFDQTISRAFVVSDTAPSAFELIATSLDRIASVVEMDS